MTITPKSSTTYVTLAIIILGASASIMMMTAMTTTAPAFAQEEGTPDQAMSFGGVSPEAKQLAISIAVQQLWNLTAKDPSITFSEDGTLSINEFTFLTDGRMKMTSATVQHNMTPSNGYVYDNSILYAPNGTQIFP